MKKKGILKGILAIALVLGIGLVLMSCLEDVTITVRNASSVNNESIEVSVWLKGRNDTPIGPRTTVSNGASTTFGPFDYNQSYQVRVRPTTNNYTTFYYPPSNDDDGYGDFSGAIKLKFDGSRIVVE